MVNNLSNSYLEGSDYLPMAVVLEWWLELTPGHEKSKIYAIIQACKKRGIKYRLPDGISIFSLSTSNITESSILEIHQKSFKRWLEKFEAKPKSIDNGKINPREERTYQHIIGALLECVTGNFKDKKFSSETELREFLANKFDGFQGVTLRTMADKFALAKKALNEELD